MKLAIVISTYRRPDGKSPKYLDATLSAIDKQTHRDYKIFLIGDAYDRTAELFDVVGRHEQVICVNMDKSPERDRYGFGNMQMWCAGGVSAVNWGIDLALSHGYEYVCHQAHDDIWEPNHLATINEMVELHEPVFCCTLSTYGKHVLPNHKPTNEIIYPFYPIDGGIIAQTTCVNYKRTTLRPVDRYYLEGITSPCDAYLWEQLRNEMKANGQIGYLYTRITCHHDEEGYAMNRNQIKK